MEKSKALQIAESLKQLNITKRRLCESLGDALSHADDSNISKAAKAAKNGDGATFLKEWSGSGDRFMSAFEDWKDSVDGSLAAAAKKELGLTDKDDLIVALKFIDENGH